MPVGQVERADEHRRGAELAEGVEHQDAAAEAVGAHVERRPEARERVEAARPGLDFGGRRRGRVVLAVVEDDLEEPRERLEIGRRRIGRRERRAAAVVDALDVEVGEALRIGEARLLLGVAVEDGRRVLRLVFEPGDVAAVVDHGLQEPAKHAARLLRVGEARRGRLAEEARDVVPRDRAPVDLARGEIGALLDAREGALDARAVALDVVAAVVERVARAARDERGDEHLRAREDEFVGLLRVAVLGEPLVGAPRDRGEVHAPPDAERALPLARVVGERELRPAAAARGGERQGHRERAGPCHGVGAERLADAADGAAAFRRRDRREGHRRESVGLRRGLLGGVRARARPSGCAVVSWEAYGLVRVRGRTSVEPRGEPNLRSLSSPIPLPELRARLDRTVVVRVNTRQDTTRAPGLPEGVAAMKLDAQARCRRL